MINYIDHRHPLRDAGFLHSPDQCLHICALKNFVLTMDREPLTDDTVSMILTYQYGTEQRPFPTAAVYQHLCINKGDRRNQAVQGIWRQLEDDDWGWARRAFLCYWSWMEYMKVVWNR